MTTAPLEFTCIVEEVKLILQNREIPFHESLDDFLLHALLQQIFLDQSKQVVAFCTESRLGDNLS